ncbi:DUF6262 family protein [Streptomyces alanosinicus]|uniref:DUF6262 family protein n=1 Tax=Streptomyces alanosinicus TaxID=68171 RepID=UPI00227D83D5|nr:DUF6262 family protein [Streptomyces alanosinicus]
MQALRTLDAAGKPVTFETVAKQAGVSRSGLYAQPDVRAEIERLRAAHRRERRHDSHQPTTGRGRAIPGR